MENNKLYITECPRDAMQGIQDWIPTEEKVAYLNQLLQVGFDRLDAGSFVSPKAIPQMADTPDVFKRLDMDGSRTEILAIIANARGAEEAVAYEMVRFLGYPFSVSETFQKRNTQADISESLARLEQIQSLCQQHGKELQVYLSMAFGNPYGDPWSPEIVMQWALKLKELGIRHIALADTTGISSPETIKGLFTALIPEMQGVHLSAHLHATPFEVQVKAKAAWETGCRSFDTALKGLGGCPMAADELTGNMDTEQLIHGLEELGMVHHLQKNALQEATVTAQNLFNRYH